MPFLPFASSTSESGWELFLGTPITVVGIVLGSILLRFAILRAIRRAVTAMETRTSERTAGAAGATRVIRAATGLDSERRRQRAATMGSLLRSVTTLVVFGIAAMMVLAELAVPLSPLLASAGVGGVALGFGAQSLVRDFLSGIFMIMEDQYGVGDVIDTGQAIGTVEEVALRVTRVRDATGVVWYVRNGEILRVGNRSQGWSTTTIDIPIAYDQSVEVALATLRSVTELVDDESPWKEKLLETPQVAGVESVIGGGVTLRIIAKCVPNEQYAVSREIRERAKIALDAAGIRSPQLPPYASGPTQ